MLLGSFVLNFQMYFYLTTAAIKPDPTGPEPVASCSSSDTPGKTSNRTSGRGKSGKIKVEPEEEEEEEPVNKAATKSGGKGKSGAKERPGGKCHLVNAMLNKPD